MLSIHSCNTLDSSRESSKRHESELLRLIIISHTLNSSIPGRLSTLRLLSILDTAVLSEYPDLLVQLPGSISLRPPLLPEKYDDDADADDDDDDDMKL